MEPEQQTTHERSELHHHHHPTHHPEPVKIHVNEKPVRLKGHHHSGLQIKETAREQRVKIELDFLLYLLRQHQPNKPIGDHEEVYISDESRFHAIADDDNS
jgi:hypothetical protein